MQITIELDQQHIEKLHEQEKKLKKNISELITLAIDESYNKKETQAMTEGQKAYQIMQESGFIGCLESDKNLSENYIDYLDWSHKV